MHSSLLDILVDPTSKTPLQLEAERRDSDGNITEGALRGADGRSYPITNGIPRFVATEDSGQLQTADSFGFKWRQRSTYDSPQVQANAREWLLERYGFESAEAMRRHFGSRPRVLDAGCGSGYSSALWLDGVWPDGADAAWYGADISEAIDVAQDRLGTMADTHFVQADIMHLPFPEQTFDFCFSEGVLHHTPSTEQALKALVPLLKPGGEMMFYVYRKKAPIREFADDHIRDVLSRLDPEEAWAMLRPLTQLGQSLADLHAEVDVPEDIPYLGIKAGRYDVQRLIYWFFAKLFWNEAYTFEENNHVNFDWYHPTYAHRHTEEEIRRWCDDAGLSIVRFNAQLSGFTIRAVRD